METSRGGAVADTWIVCGDESRRRRGCLGHSAETRVVGYRAGRRHTWSCLAASVVLIALFTGLRICRVDALRPFAGGAMVLGWAVTNL